MNRYETVFILTPVLSDDQMKETVSKYHKYMEDRGAKIIFQDNWGLRKLAYPIQKKTTGFYHLVEFETDNANFIGELELTYKRDERVMRFLTIKLDKHSIAYNEKKRNKKENKAEKPEKKEKVSNN